MRTGVLHDCGVLLGVRNAREVRDARSSRAVRSEGRGQAHGRRRAGAALLAIALVSLGCAACGKKNAGGEASVASGAGAKGAPVNRTSVAPDAGPAAERDVAMWARARDGAPEDLATLAVHEGAAGLIEASAEPDLHLTALRAMAFAPGFAQLPTLARTGAGTNDDDARAALDATVELASRPRAQVASEDVDELREGCDALATLARDSAQARPRRVSAIRALRMLPCPTLAVPSDVDAR